MIRHLPRAGAALAALALTLGTTTAASASPPPHLAPPKSYYLALGDSIAYGFQTSKALAGLPPEAFNTGYADLLAARLRQLRPQIATVNYSCPGESTISFRQPCIWKTSGHALHNDYPGSQLAAALAFLTTHRGKVSPITLSLNGNDANDFLQTCPPGDLACIQNGAPAAIAAYQARLTSILRLLRTAAPDAEIIVVGAYDPNIGAFSFADPLFTQLNQAQQAAAATMLGPVRRSLPPLQPPRRRRGRNHSDLHPHPALHRRGRPPLRHRLPRAGRRCLGRIGLREPAVTMLAGQRRVRRLPSGRRTAAPATRNQPARRSVHELSAGAGRRQ